MDLRSAARTAAAAVFDVVFWALFLISAAFVVREVFGA